MRLFINFTFKLSSVPMFFAHNLGLQCRRYSAGARLRGAAHLTPQFGRYQPKRRRPGRNSDFVGATFGIAPAFIEFGNCAIFRL